MWYTGRVVPSWRRSLADTQDRVRIQLVDELLGEVEECNLRGAPVGTLWEEPLLGLVEAAGVSIPQRFSRWRWETRWEISKRAETGRMLHELGLEAQEGPLRRRAKRFWRAEKAGLQQRIGSKEQNGNE